LSLKIGDKVVIERDETRYPSKGTWPIFRGKTGTVVQINKDRKRPHLTEYAVTFGKVRKPNEHGTIPVGPDTYWFKAHEMRNIGPGRPVGRPKSTSEGNALGAVI
jgi:hypothetical protein